MPATLPQFASETLHPLPTRVGLLAKICLLALPVFATLVGLVSFTAMESSRIRHDLDQVMEEARELELSRSLAAELLGAESWAKISPSLTAGASEITADFLGHVARAGGFAADLMRGAGAADPSSSDHETREQRILRDVRQRLAHCQELSGNPASWAEISAEIESAREAAVVLESESKAESREAAEDLERRIDRLKLAHYVGGGFTLLAFLTLGIAFRSLVLVPLRRLTNATLDFGRSGEQSPVPVRAHDEFGQLTHAFNEMSVRLAAYRAHLESRVEERTRELIRTARLADLGTLTAGIAHEVNNPLSSISAGVEGLRTDLLEIDEAPPELLECIDIVLRETQRVAGITARLLRFGRQSVSVRESTDLGTEARETVSMLSFEAREKAIRIEVREVDDPQPIECDAAEWRQVFFNLLRNAMDASPRESTITVEIKSAGGGIALAVRDAGPGFEPDLIDRVFEPFVTDKDPGKGTGLGLAIVERIVRDHGGSISATNLVPTGGEVRITVPSRRPDPSDRQQIS